MRRQVLGAAAQSSAAQAPKKRSDSNFYKITIGAFLGIYLLLQLFLWLGHDSGAPAGGKGGVVRNAVRYQQKGDERVASAVAPGARGEGEEGGADGGLPVAFTGRIPEAAPKGVFFGARNEVGATLVEATSSDFRVEVTDGGPDFEWSSLDKEPPYPPMAGNEDAVSILAAQPKLAKVGEAWEAEAARLRKEAIDAAKAQGKDAVATEVAVHAVKLPPRGANELFDAMSVTIGHPCWTSPRLLYAMGLDSMAAYLSDQPPPKDLQRSKAPHAYAPLASDLWCSFHSTPVQGGLQCCCNSNISHSAFRGGVSDPPSTLPKEGGSFFCLPSLTFAGARGTGIGRLYGLFHQHAYMVTSPSTPPHVHSAVDNRLLVDTVMPRYAAHFLAQTPPEWQALQTFEERNKAVSSKYWIDASPSYFYGINVRAG